MVIDRKRAVGGLLALALFCGSSVFAQTQGTQAQAGGPPAAPSQAPASQATTQAVTGTEKSAPSTEVGTQQAAPSQRPAPQATTSAVEKEKTQAK
jgi:hypothetical protein